MTLRELEDTLPNGLHDAKLKGFDVSYADATAALRVSVLMSYVGEPTRYAEAEIQLEGLLAFVMEAPSGALRPNEGYLDVCGFETAEEYFPALLTYPPDIQTRFHSIYVGYPLNTRFHIAAMSASVRWLENQGG